MSLPLQQFQQIPDHSFRSAEHPGFFSRRDPGSVNRHGRNFLPSEARPAMPEIP